MDFVPPTQFPFIRLFRSKATGNGGSEHDYRRIAATSNTLTTCFCALAKLRDQVSRHTILTEHLFVYGTLAPGRSNAHELDDIVGTWRRAQVRGHLYPEGWGAAAGYPGIVLDPNGPEVHGFLLSSDALPPHWPRLDAFEGEGYERVRVEVELDESERVEAWVYALSALESG